MEKIYVLTMWEPWATLFVWDIKQFETRPKGTNHKGIPFEEKRIISETKLPAHLYPCLDNYTPSIY